MKEKYVIVVAGGKGLRMGGDLPKQFLPLCGRPVLLHTLTAFRAYDPTMKIILVLPESHQEYWKALCEEYAVSIPHTIVTGGETRFHSVQNALTLVPDNALVAVHDGVRPLVPEALIAEAFARAETGKGAYPVIPVTDSLRKYVNSLSVSESVDRSQYCLVQTPQVFQSNTLKHAYAQDYRDEFTDDVSVVEAAGDVIPVMIEGAKENIKITTQTDMLVAEAFLRCKT